jgi:hypothetical protein
MVGTTDIDFAVTLSESYGLKYDKF